MKPQLILTAVLTLMLGAAAALVGTSAADEPKKGDEPKKADDTPKAVEPGTLVVIDAAGKEHKLKSWKFTAGIRHLSWLAAAAPEKEPAEKEPKPRPKPGQGGPEALAVREENSTVWANGVLTLVPLDRLRSVEFDAEKETITVRVATGAGKPETDLTLTGTTQFQGINKLNIDAEVDKGELGVAEVRFLGGVAKGIRGVRFPAPKAVPEMKEGRPAAVTYGDKKGKHVVNVTDLQGLYRTADGEVLSGLLFFKKTIKIDVAKLKKIVPNKAEEDTIWGVTLKSGGDEESLSLMTNVQLDGKNATLEGLLGRAPSGYKLFPVHLLHEVEFDVKKDEAEPKKPDAEKDK
jgi:hypothetical protein